MRNWGDELDLYSTWEGALDGLWGIFGGWEGEYVKPPLNAEDCKRVEDAVPGCKFKWGEWTRLVEQDEYDIISQAGITKYKVCD